MSDQVDIGLLRGLLERGTKGAWEFWPRGEIVASETSETVASGDIDIHGEEVYIRIRTADGELIVAAVNALPALLDELERLRVVAASCGSVVSGLTQPSDLTPAMAMQAMLNMAAEILQLRECQAANLAIKQGMLERFEAAQTVTRPPTDASLTATDMLILRVAPSPGDATATEAASYTLSIADMSVEQDRWQTPGGEQIGPNAYRYNMRDFMDGGGADEQREEATHG